MKNSFFSILAIIAIILAIISFSKTCNIHHVHKDASFKIDSVANDEPYVETRTPHKLDKAAALSLIKGFEGFRDTVYKCPNGIPTVGWGTTKGCLVELYKQGYISDTTFYKWGDVLDKEKADVILSKTIDMIYKSSMRYVPDLKYLSPKAQASFISWTYQCGIGSVQKKTGIIGVFPDITEHIDDKMLYDILVERAFYSKYKERRLKEAALIIGLK